jgi:hypothetical protein
MQVDAGGTKAAFREDVRLLVYFYPQYHRMPENDQFWCVLCGNMVWFCLTELLRGLFWPSKALYRLCLTWLRVSNLT